MVEREGIPFHHVPGHRGNEGARLRKDRRRSGRRLRADLIVLARYMQIVPPALCDAWPGRIINIHHSFLPSFVGANPYQKAYERGVKLIGATCHYVTADLDAGPIVDQEVDPRGALPRCRKTCCGSAAIASASRWPAACAITSATAC